MIIWNTTSLILCNIRSVCMRTRYQHYRILHSSLVIMCSIYVVKVNDNGFLQKLTSGSHYLKLAAALHWQSVAGAQLPACTWPPGAVQVSLWGYTGKEREKKNVVLITVSSRSSIIVQTATLWKLAKSDVEEKKTKLFFPNDFSLSFHFVCQVILDHIIITLTLP